MSSTVHPRTIDATALRGWGRLAADAVVGLSRVVEGMHREIAAPFPFLWRRRGPTRGITGFVYRSIRGTARLVGFACEASLEQLAATGEVRRPTRREEAARAILNGVAGDYLAASGNPLAIEMRLRRGGHALRLERSALARAIPNAPRRVVVLVHGSCMNDLSWARADQDYGAALERDLGYAALYLHYNTGLHVSTNGDLLATILEELVRAWPVPLESIAVVAHSMGGLVVRSACHVAAARRLSWPALLDACFFLGTPHLGAALERGGHQLHSLLRVSRYSAPLAHLGAIRSAGVTDLRHGSVLDEDWQGRDRFARRFPRPAPVALPPGVRCFAIAGSTSRAGALVGDGLVSVRSALGMHRDARRDLSFRDSRRWVARGVGHVALLGDARVYDFIRRSLETG